MKIAKRARSRAEEESSEWYLKDNRLIAVQKKYS